MILVAVFRARLEQRGYPTALFSEVLATVSYADRSIYLHGPTDPSASPDAGDSRVPGPVYVATNGLHEFDGSLARVINSVYARHTGQTPGLQSVLGDNVVVAYKNHASVAQLLVHAKD